VSLHWARFAFGAILSRSSTRRYWALVRHGYAFGAKKFTVFARRHATLNSNASGNNAKTPAPQKTVGNALNKPMR
jgi:hypothetical protein